MQFLKGLRDRVRRGEISTSIRIWQSSRVRVGGRYSLPPGQIEVTSLREISLTDISPEMARTSGFVGIADLLKTAKHGPGRRVFLVGFRYLPTKEASQQNKALSRRKVVRALAAAVLAVALNASAPKSFAAEAVARPALVGNQHDLANLLTFYAEFVSHVRTERRSAAMMS